MRIAYLGNFQPGQPNPWSTETHVAASLEALRHEVLRHQENETDFDAVPSMAQSAGVDLVLWTRTWHLDVEAQVRMLSGLRQRAIPSAALHLDRYWGLDREHQIADEPWWRCDAVFSADGDNDERFAAAGVNHHWLPPAVFGPECTPGTRRPQFASDVAFVGSWQHYHNEHPRLQLVAWLQRTYGRRCRLWPRGRAIRGRHLNDLYASARVIVGDSCFAETSRRYVSDRLFETVGRGGFLLFPHVEWAATQLLDGEHVRYYEPGNFAELARLIEHYTDPAHDDERRRIAAAGQAEVLAHHTYAHRMAEMLAVIADDEHAAAPPAPVRLVPSTKLACGDCETIGSTTCGACGGKDLTSVVCLGDLPLANGLLEDPTSPGPRYPLHVLACPTCLAVQLSRQVPPETMFVRYPYFSSQSATMVDSAAALVDWTVRARGLDEHDLVLEIGSNDGYLLRHYVQRGIPTVGVDPATAAAEVARGTGVGTEVAFFDSELAERYRHQVSVVHANNVLAHVPDPAAVLAAAHRVLRPDGVVIIETPWLARLVAEAQFDTVYHEHRYMWSLHALGALLSRAEFTVTDVEHLDIHGGSLRIFATPRPSLPARSVAAVMAEERAVGLDSLAGLDGFGHGVRARMETLRPWLASLGPGVAGYGAAAKGTMMLNAIGAVDFVVDSTPAKQGRWLPGVGVPVLGPKALEERMPADCVLLAWNFEAELLTKLAGYIARGGRVWTTTPEPRLLSLAQEAHAVPA